VPVKRFPPAVDLVSERWARRRRHVFRAAPERRGSGQSGGPGDPTGASGRLKEAVRSLTAGA